MKTSSSDARWGVSSMTRAKVWIISVRESDWLVATVEAITQRGGADRQEALRLMTQRYIEQMHTNQPVHTWPQSP